MNEIDRLAAWLREQEKPRQGIHFDNYLATRTVLANSAFISELLGLVHKDPTLFKPSELEIRIFRGVKWDTDAGTPKLVASRLIAAGMLDFAIGKRIGDKQKSASSRERGGKTGRPRDEGVTDRVLMLRNAGVKGPADLRNSQKRRNAFAALEGRIEIPGFPRDKQWLSLLDDPDRSEELKSVLEVLRKNLARRR